MLICIIQQSVVFSSVPMVSPIRQEKDWWRSLLLHVMGWWSIPCQTDQTKSSCDTDAVLEIRTTCHMWDLWKLAWSCKQLHLPCSRNPWIYQVLSYSMNFKAPMELWNQMSKTVFSCDQAALWMVQSVRPSVRPSHLFDYVPINVSSWNFQELLPMTKVTSMQKVKVRGQRSRSQRSRPNLTVSRL